MLQDILAGAGLEKDVARLNDHLQEAIQSGLPELSRMSGHIIFSGGKRLRPILGLAVFKANQGQSTDDLIPIAVALELIHTATLIHDDIIDNSALRRGAPSVHKMFGKEKALVTGDFLFARAYGICSRYGANIIDIAAQACVSLAEGEIMQMNNPLEDITVKRYTEIISRKTANLFSAGTRIAALLARARSEEVEAMAAYGQQVGLAFQMYDDHLDMTGDEVMGKPLGTDIKEGKPTLAVIRARDQLKARPRKQLLSLYRKKRRTQADVEKVLKLIGSTDGLTYSRKRARELARKAKKNLDILRDNRYTDLLRALAEYIVEREV